MRIVTDDTAGVSAWVASRIPGLERGFGPCAAIGVADAENRPVAGFVFHDMQPWPDGSTIQLSLASDDPNWLRQRKRIGREVLKYAFYTADCWKVWTAVPHTNDRAFRLGLTFGFTKEATLADQFGRKKHALISRLFKKDYDRIYGVAN